MKNKKILILGGTGALGKSLIKRYYDNNDIIVFSRDEHKHVDLLKKYDKIESYLGDIRDKSSIENALIRFNPEVVINTAALKHVPICENNPIESVKTNIIGHQNVIECVSSYRRPASGRKIETLIFVSTDKACKPINVYGMCKAISEQLYISFAKQEQVTKVVMVRYGNVLESTGSVIPYFKSLLENGSDFLPITHSDMTRFLLTLDKAVDLIDWSYHTKNTHGKIAVPKVKSMRVVNIAKSLIKYYGKTDKVSLKNIGIRSGEKLHEEMISTEEWLRTEDLENYLITSETINDGMWSYSSKNSVLTEDETYEFLSESGVIN
jgi:UDP-N-acetylglucosamine 4,6-dehydratase/5-epimerase